MYELMIDGLPVQVGRTMWDLTLLNPAGGRLERLLTATYLHSWSVRIPNGSVVHVMRKNDQAISYQLRGATIEEVRYHDGTKPNVLVICGGLGLIKYPLTGFRM